jgi:site-specific DNA recombinase
LATGWCFNRSLSGTLLGMTSTTAARFVPKELDWGEDWELGVAYLRISDDKEGLELGVIRQYDDIHDLAFNRKIRLTKIYCDNDIGASTRSKKRRPDYETMVEAAQVSEFKWILSYSNSRLTRRPMELENLIVLHEQVGTKMLTKVSGEADLSTADGRIMARVFAAFDAGEAERTGERVTRKHVELAQDGKLCGGIRPFGWLADQKTVDPAEANLINIAADVLLDGTASQGHIVRAWNELGVLTPFGNHWRPTSFRKMLEKPRLCGWRVHRQEIHRDADGNPIKGVWEPVLDVEKWEKLQGYFKAQKPNRPGAKRQRRGAVKYLCTGLLRCGKCNGRMYGHPGDLNKAPQPMYHCSGNVACTGTSVSAGNVDRLVQRLVLAKIASAELPDAPVAAHWPHQEELTNLQNDRADLMKALQERRMKASTVIPTVEALEDQIAALEEDQKEWQAHQQQAPQLIAVADLEEFERDYSQDQRREIMKQWLQAVVVQPGKRGYRFDPSRVEPVWWTAA